MCKDQLSWWALFPLESQNFKIRSKNLQTQSNAPTKCIASTLIKLQPNWYSCSLNMLNITISEPLHFSYYYIINLPYLYCCYHYLKYSDWCIYLILFLSCPWNYKLHEHQSLTYSLQYSELSWIYFLIFCRHSKLFNE